MPEDLKQNLTVLMLAAGGSSRMGKPKLAQKIGNESLFEKAIAQIKSVQAPLKLVILGANKELYQSLIPANYKMIVNDHWDEGLSSSIKAGIEYIERFRSGTRHVLIVLADMPLVSSDHLDLLIKNLSDSKKGIIVSNYGPSMGPPAIFSRKYFPELLKMHGDKGAKEIFIRYKDDVQAINFPDGLVDIDTPEDLLKIQKRL